MGQFRAWVERTRAGSFVVRHQNANGERETDYIVHKYDRGSGTLSDLSGKSLANTLCDSVRQKFFSAALGQKDMTKTVANLLEVFLTEREANNLSRFTLQHNRNDIGAYFRDCEIKSLADMTHDSVKRWKLSMFDAKMMIGTIRGRLSDLRTFCNWLVFNNYLNQSPFGKRMMPQKAEPIPRFYTMEEYRALDKALEQIDAPTRLLCSLAHSSGLRKMEALQVCYEDILWYEGGAELVLRKGITKGKKRSRNVPLEPETIALFGSLKSGRLIERTHNQINHFHRRALALAQLPSHLTIHGLRHTCIKNWLQNGMCSTKEAMDLAGHSSYDAMQVYANFERGHLREVVKRAYEERKRKERAAGLLGGQFNEIV